MGVILVHINQSSIKCLGIKVRNKSSLSIFQIILINNQYLRTLEISHMLLHTFTHTHTHVLKSGKEIPSISGFILEHFSYQQKLKFQSIIFEIIIKLFILCTWQVNDVISYNSMPSSFYQNNSFILSYDAILIISLILFFFFASYFSEIIKNIAYSNICENLATLSF